LPLREGLVNDGCDVADEPTGSLDSETGLEIMHLFSSPETG
jgi:ABC-type lipoprotein export system ATPase subunit